MDLRELVRRLEKIEEHCQKNKDKDTEDMVGILIDDLIDDSDVEPREENDPEPKSPSVKKNLRGAVKIQ